MIKYAAYLGLYHCEYKISHSSFREEILRSREIEMYIMYVPLEIPRVARDNRDALSRGRWSIQATETLDPFCRRSVLETTKSLSRTVTSISVTASESTMPKERKEGRERERVSRNHYKLSEQKIKERFLITFINIDRKLYCSSEV